MTREPPKGSTISVEHGANHTVYSWRATERHPIQWMPTFFGSFMLFAAVFIPFAETSFAVEEEIQTPFIELLISSALCLAGGLTLLYAGMTKRARETIMLERDIINYDTGPTILPFPLMYFFGPTLIYSPQLFGGSTASPINLRRKQYSLKLDEIGAFTIERVGERQRLRVDHGVERIEIGYLLREPEREWLADQLIRWQQTGHSDSQDAAETI